MRIAQINMVDFGSTGKIMMEISKTAREKGAEVKTFSTRRQSLRYSPMPPAPEGHTYYGSFLENNLHYIFSRITGKYGFYSRLSTWNLIRELKAFAPDVIHLHNMHSAFLHLPVLLNYVKKNNIPLIWTLHDCWVFTGHCAHFAYENCERWKTGCHSCPRKQDYPRSLMDFSKSIWKKKKKMIEGIPNLTVVTPSVWLAELAKQSFLKNAKFRVINNGIDLSVFKPTESDFRKKYNCQDKYLILGVAFGWSHKKGLDVFLDLAKNLSDGYQVVLVGTDKRIDAQLPDNIISIHRTRNQQELAEIYTAADLLVNPTREETYPTVNMEALACGTPVLTFRTGGSPEIPDETCGCTVECDNICALKNEIARIREKSSYTKEACLERAKAFDMYRRFDEYVKVYSECVKSK